ncbi:GAF domain-containing sensor histidine kinase [Arthrobacter antibioticus]|uniref:GAF domain-containing sensor histidine kinase n=1 Tax=Arthrobacter sp. H35-MC1 TaxID=3046203 RepID=UPI0024B89D57|nr:GAF domain-containing protein [Arthrobacter sp. H35-MC1]MDJ0318838.1 GAF domain-containing protein [Arthrobacter sp. H35-MC1]
MKYSDANNSTPLLPAAAGTRIEDLLREFVDRAGELLSTQERMRGLLEAVVSVAEDLSLDAVLERVVRSACTLLDARYAALGVIAEDQSLSHFITVGIDEELIRKIGPLPTGHGVLGLLTSDPHPMRLRDLHDHPASYGFPEHHPSMVSFLGVPVRVRGRVFGNLYLTEKSDGADFTAEDEELAVALAAAAGVAIENARLFEDARRRSSWLEASMSVTGRMMDDDRNITGSSLDMIAATALAESDSALAMIGVSSDKGPDLFVAAAAGERASLLVGRSLVLDSPEIVEVLRTGVPTVFNDATGLLGKAEGTTLGPTIVIPLGPQGTNQGLLILAKNQDSESYSKIVVEMSAVFGSHVALALELARTHRLREQIMVFTDRDRIARDLHDVVIQRLFAAGLSMQSMQRLITDKTALERIKNVTTELDETIRDLRNTIYSLQVSSNETELLSDLILRAVRNAAKPLAFAPRLNLAGPIDSTVSEETAKHLLAVLSEGLSNAVRHSKAGVIEVCVDVTADKVTVTIVDDGIGVGEPGRRSGLLNMEKRAKLLNGTFEIESTETTGTRMTWEVPSEDAQ